MRTALATVVVVVMATIGWLGVSPISGATATSSPSASTVVEVPSPQPSSTVVAGASALSGGAVAALPVASASTSAGLLAGLTDVPWLEARELNGSSVPVLASLPNLGLLAHPATAVDGRVAPAYSGGAPAPLGLADYGLGATPYAYNTSHFLGQVTLSSPPDVTDPGSTLLIDPGGAGSGYVGSLNEFSVQLNTVASNVTIPGSDDGVFWTQNVVDWNDTAIHFADDIFNQSSQFQRSISTGTILSGCGNGTSGVDTILTYYEGVYQCVGGTLPVGPSAYPVTLQLYNNLTVNAQHRVQLTFGYRVVEAGLGRSYAGVSDTVVFDNPSEASPATDPGFSVDGFAPAPGGLLADAELDLVGDVGGDNAMFQAINGTLELEYSNRSAGGWANVPSAFNYGSDTGETSEGIADYWEPNATLEVHDGPSMLYGLWNTSSSVGVPSGALQLAGTVSPSYAFVFVSNTPPVADPFADYPAEDNLSWLPTNSTGAFDTYLPPTGGGWTASYYVQAFADGFAEANGSAVSSNDTAYALDLAPAPGTLDAPLYASSNAGAAELADAVSGGSLSPYTFQGLVISPNASFDHLNDYGYPTFELAVFQGVTEPIVVDGVAPAPSSSGEERYWIDTGGITLVPDGYAAQIEIVGGTEDQVLNESFAGSPNGQGGSVVLWDDVDANATRITTVGDLPFDLPAVFVGESTGTTVADILAINGTGVEDVGSTGTSGRNLSAEESAVALVVYSDEDGRFTGINATAGADAVEAGDDTAAEVFDDPGLGLAGMSGGSVADVGGAVSLALSERSTLTNLSSVPSEVGTTLYLAATNSVAVQGLTSSGLGASAALLYDAARTTLDGVRSEDETTGVVLAGETTGTVITGGVFTGDRGYAVEIASGTGNLVDDNAFLENDGSGLTYSPATVQAYSVARNAFNSSAGVGNYWSDWHTFTGDHLSPYPISNGVKDDHPLPTGPGASLVNFTEEGLPPTGAAWTVAVGGVAETLTAGSATTSTIPFDLPNGSYSFLVTGPAGYVPSLSGDPGQPNGTFVVDGATVAENVRFTSRPGGTGNLTFVETGLRHGTSWCASLDGAWRSCGEGTSFEFRNLELHANLSAEVSSFTGLTTVVEVNGSSTVGASLTVNLSASSKVAVLYGFPVTFQQSGALADEPWTITVQSTTEQSTSGLPLAFLLANGTYRFRVVTAPGVSVSPSSGLLRVSGSSEAISVSTYVLTFQETGLPSGTNWSVRIGSVTRSTDGPALVFDEPSGRYAYRVTVTGGAGLAPASGSIEVLGANTTVELTSYALTFVAVGLPPLTNWYVTLDGRITAWGYSGPTGSSSITFAVGDGRLGYVDGVTGGDSLGPRAGTVLVAGANRTVDLSAYAVTFREQGLPSGTTWTVTVDGIEAYNTTYDGSGAITFYEGNGTFGYRLAVLADDAASGSPRTVVVDGHSVDVAVTFAPK